MRGASRGGVWIVEGEKSRLWGRLFSFFTLLSSEYEVWADLLPDFRGNIGVEVVLYQRSLLSPGVDGGLTGFPHCRGKWDRG